MLRLEPIEPRVLDFDVECRPIAWYGGDFVTKQITAIAWTWVDEDDDVEVAFIGESGRSVLVLEEEQEMLESFLAHYAEADIVTGHFIRGFDLPLINGSLMRLGLPLLGEKRVHDTKMDLARAQGISKSQENLGAMYELEHPKIPMNTALWARGNMLLPDGIDATIERVTGDVAQHVELRAEMLALGHLGPVTLWSPGPAPLPEYTA
jgi:hypothetical protein